MLRRYRRLWIGIAVLVAVQAAAIAVYAVKRERTSSPAFAVETLTPRAAPVLTFERVDRSTTSLASLEGKVVMVHFWATWCEPCRDELPGLLELANELDKAGRFELIAVSVDDEWAAMRRFFGGEVPRAVVRPDAAEAHRRFGASTLPDTYLVDARGNVVVRYAGARDWRSTRAREHLDFAIAAYGDKR